ncbi:MAG: DUF4390 domain-containing protein [Nitrospirota bacterium]
MRIWALILAIALLSVLPLEAATGPRIRNLNVGKKNEEIFVSFELIKGFNATIKRDIQDGIEKDFYYYVVLNQKHKNWFYEEVAEKTIRYQVKYDTLTRVYAVRRFEGAHSAVYQFDSQNEMESFVARGEKIRLTPITRLKKNHRYSVWVKAQMKAAQVPLHLDRLLFFVPFLDLDTPWNKSESLYADPH